MIASARAQTPSATLCHGRLPPGPKPPAAEVAEATHHRGVVQRKVRGSRPKEPGDCAQELCAVAALHRPGALGLVELAALARLAVGELGLGLRGCSGPLRVPRSGPRAGKGGAWPAAQAVREDVDCSREGRRHVRRHRRPFSGASPLRARALAAAARP
eukprot:15039504-Alexandrium_andersonii.AAC.1